MARGAGTGLSGGAVPADGQLVLATGRLNALGRIDTFGQIWVNDRRVARVDVGDEVRVLSEGEWSDWVPVSFEMIPNVVSADGMVRMMYRQHLRSKKKKKPESKKK